MKTLDLKLRKTEKKIKIKHEAFFCVFFTYSAAGVTWLQLTSLSNRCGDVLTDGHFLGWKNIKWTQRRRVRMMCVGHIFDIFLQLTRQTSAVLSKHHHSFCPMKLTSMGQIRDSSLVRANRPPQNMPNMSTTPG